MPIRWQGWAVMAAMLAVLIPCGTLFVLLQDANRTISLICGGIAAVTGLIGYGTIEWKVERDYNR